MPNVEEQVVVSFNNLEADFMSDLVVNCETPSDILTFTQFIEATIAPEMKNYQEVTKKAQATFQERVENIAKDHLEIDEKGQYVHDAQNNPVAKPVWAFERELKQDDRYFKTNTAVQDMTGLASEIARQFGKM